METFAYFSKLKIIQLIEIFLNQNVVSFQNINKFF